MSKYISKFPRKNKEFNTHLVGAVRHLNDNHLRLKVDPDNLSDLNDLFNHPTEGWKVIYKITEDDGTATKNARKKREILKNKIVKVLLLIFGDIPNSVLTVDDRSALRLNQNKKGKTRVSRMKRAPNYSLVKTFHLLHRLRFQNPLTPESRAMPYKQHIVLECYIGAAGIADKDVQWVNAQDVTRAFFNKTFSEGDVSKTAYYRACYENSRGERSSWGKVGKFVIA